MTDDLIAGTTNDISTHVAQLLGEKKGFAMERWT